MPKEKRGYPHQAWSVSLNGREIDIVFYDLSYTSAEEVKRSLVNHDGYDPSIVVRRA